MLDPCTLDRRWKLQRFLEPAIRDLHLVIRHSDRARSVFSATDDVKNIPLYVDLDVLDRHPRELDLYDPAVGGLINVGCGVPELPRANIFRRTEKLKMPIERFCHCVW